jgi:hypothetical protein
MARHGSMPGGCLRVSRPLVLLRSWHSVQIDGVLERNPVSFKSHRILLLPTALGRDPRPPDASGDRGNADWCRGSRRGAKQRHWR